MAQADPDRHERAHAQEAPEHAPRPAGLEEAEALGRKWLELGQVWLQGLAQSAAGSATRAPAGPADEGAADAADAQGASTTPPATDPFEVGRALIEAWRTAWAGTGAAQATVSQVFSDWLASMPPLGPAREQTRLLRELAEAQAECRRLEQELAAVLLQVQTETLERLAERVQAAGVTNSAEGYRRIHDLWVECGEQVYAQVAHSEAYARLQGALGNATMRLRARQQALLEQALKQLDLPTRSELNTLHRQVRELRQKLAALEAPRAGVRRRPAKQT